jgi:transketolase
MDKITEKLKDEEDKWNKKWEKYKELYPEMAQEWEKWHAKDLPGDIVGDEFWAFEEKSAATRQWSYEVLNRLAGKLSNLTGGSADLAPSTKTNMKDREHFSDKCRTGTNMHFGVREHAMGAIANGMSLHGGFKVYVSTFLVFSDYMKPAIRLSSIMKQPVVYVFTHDSIGVGEDGPTHEPIEQLAALRSIPGLTVIRPADALETAAAWYAALFINQGPTALILTRQNVPPLTGTGKQALKGAYIIMDSKKEEPDIILMASGSEVSLACKAADELVKMDIDARVVSMPSWELFEKQDKSYREKILPEKVRKRIAVEAASSFGWQKFTGLDGKVISIDHFGASAPGGILFEKFGFTVRNIVESSLSLLKENTQKKENKH